MEQPDYQKALDKAKINLMSRPDSVFFATLCFSLKHSFSNEIPTACTDGKQVLYNPEFFMRLNAEEQVFLLLHETLHVAYMHMLRLKALPEGDHRKWNIAGDHVINLQLIERKYRMPSMGLADPKYKGLSTEEVYKLLPDDPSAPCDMDLVMPSDPAAAEEAAAQIQDALVRATLQSKMSEDRPGTIPGELEIFLNKLLNPKLPWQRILAKYMRNLAKTDYSFKKPNRRFFPEHHLPSLYGSQLINLAVAVDTSGSVSDADFLRFISETHSILKMMKPEKITVIQFDTELKSVDEVRNLNDLGQLSFTGRGGTLIQPVLEWANEHRPQLLLVFTDGHFRWPTVQTKTDTLWLIHENPGFTAPMGKVIHYEI